MGAHVLIVKPQVLGTVICPACGGNNPKCGHCLGKQKVNITSRKQYNFAKKNGALINDYLKANK